MSSLSEAGRSGGLPDAALAFAIRVASAGLLFGLQVLLARLMPIDGYGGFVTLWTWLLAVGSFGALGLAQASVRFVPRYLARGRRQAVGAFFRVGFIAVALGSVGLSIVGLSASTLLPGDLGLIVFLVAMGLPFLAMEYYLEGIARGFGWYRLTTIPIYIIRPILIGSTALLLSALGVELTLPVVGAVVVGSMGVITLGLALVLRRRLAPYRPNAAPTRAEASLWIRASLPLSIVSGLDDLVIYADVLLISLMLPSEAVGVYFAAARVLALANFVYFAMYLVAGRRFALDLAARDRSRLQSSLLETSRLMFWLTALAVGATLLAGPLLLAAFGQAFEDGYGVMIVLGAGMIARALAGQADEMLIVSGRQKQAAWILAATVGVNLSISALLIPWLGIMGAAVGTAIAMATRSMLVAFTVYRLDGLRIVSVAIPSFGAAKS
ncbi:oligosaccharide flippase family protein [Chelativorans sp. YIM 93263]|uniref:oligosaccharide flippase family protein n=1 Tax=Chelativorans sp. YIM 93263 TaxID=2906648 RepID=UPI002379B570|nr:polysaccharide biosynthesis C-terminal domain-containing protein [Chelativorans sp. YIM 93263]